MKAGLGSTVLVLLSLSFLSSFAMRAALAQGFNFTESSDGAPLEIYADQGLELSQDSRLVTATGNARAVHGRVTVTADKLLAYYRPRSGAAAATPPAATPAAAGGMGGGNTEIWQVIAEGHVVISTPTESAVGDHADYNIDQARVILTGNNLRLSTATDVVTARDSLEYWEDKKMAVARGQAVAVRQDKRLQADTLTADFGENAQKQMVIRRAHALNHVMVTTATEHVTGDRGEYDVESGIVTVTGSVKITREGNQLDGGYAVVNLNTGISKLFPAAPGTGGGDTRVKGLLIPRHDATPSGGNPGGASKPPATGPTPK